MRRAQFRHASGRNVYAATMPSDSKNVWTTNGTERPIGSGIYHFDTLSNGPLEFFERAGAGNDPLTDPVLGALGGIDPNSALPGAPLYATFDPEENPGELPAGYTPIGTRYQSSRLWQLAVDQARNILQYYWVTSSQPTDRYELDWSIGWNLNGLQPTAARILGAYWGGPFRISSYDGADWNERARADETTDPVITEIPLTAADFYDDKLALRFEFLSPQTGAPNTEVRLFLTTAMLFVGAGGSGGGGSVPGVCDVRSGVVYDDGTKVGALVLPDPSEVKQGVGYGCNGTEFTGTLVADDPTGTPGWIG